MGYVETAFAADGTRNRSDGARQGVAGARGADAFRAAPLQARRVEFLGVMDMSETGLPISTNGCASTATNGTVGITKLCRRAIGRRGLSSNCRKIGQSRRQGRRSRGGRKRQGGERNLCARRRHGDGGQRRRSNDDPAKVNADPEGEGWFFKLKLADTGEFSTLMTRRRNTRNM